MLQNRIVGIAGQQGDGKTTVLTELGYIAWRNNMKIYSTYHVNYSDNDEVRDYIPIGHMDDIKHMHGGHTGGVFLADELYQWLFSRSSQSEMNKAISMVLMVARKRGISVLYTSHHPMHVDVMLRRVTNLWILPYMIPKQQISNDKIDEIAKHTGLDPFIVKRYYRKKLKQNPEYWMIHCDIFNALDKRIGTFTLRDLPHVFKMFDTTEEINPLDMEGKPEYIREKGMELELHVENVLSDVFTVERIPHSGRESDTHADHYIWPKNSPHIMYYENCCGVYKNRLNKKGIEIKALLEESQENKDYETHTIIIFPYQNNLWYLPVEPNHYYLDYTSNISISYDLKQLIKPLDDLLVRYTCNDSNGENIEKSVCI